MMGADAAADMHEREVVDVPAVTECPLLMGGIARRLAEAAPAAIMRVIEVAPVAGAALLGLDHVHATPAAQARLRALYQTSVPRLRR
jgi:hypothetical protein